MIYDYKKAERQQYAEVDEKLEIKSSKEMSSMRYDTVTDKLFYSDGYIAHAMLKMSGNISKCQ
jgi:hypothetical protein